jgi:hypothetical protein
MRSNLIKFIEIQYIDQLVSHLTRKIPCRFTPSLFGDDSVYKLPKKSTFKKWSKPTLPLNPRLKLWVKRNLCPDNRGRSDNWDFFMISFSRLPQNYIL